MTKAEEMVEETDLGLLKLPDKAIIESLKKELSEAKVKIGQLESYVEEIDNKQHLRKLIGDFYTNRVNIYQKAIQAADSNMRAIRKKSAQIARQYYELRTRVANKNGMVFVLSKKKSKLLMDLLLYGCAYAEDNNLYDDLMGVLYRDIKSQLGND